MAGEQAVKAIVNSVESRTNVENKTLRAEMTLKKGKFTKMVLVGVKRLYDRISVTLATTYPSGGSQRHRFKS